MRRNWLLKRPIQNQFYCQSYLYNIIEENCSATYGTILLINKMTICTLNVADDTMDNPLEDPLAIYNCCNASFKKETQF